MIAETTAEIVGQCFVWTLFAMVLVVWMRRDSR